MKKHKFDRTTAAIAMAALATVFLHASKIDKAITINPTGGMGLQSIGKFTGKLLKSGDHTHQDTISFSDGTNRSHPPNTRTREDDDSDDVAKSRPDNEAYGNPYSLSDAI